jgi:hypothetical protein
MLATLAEIDITVTRAVALDHLYARCPSSGTWHRVRASLSESLSMPLGCMVAGLGLFPRFWGSRSHEKIDVEALWVYRR